MKNTCSPTIGIYRGRYFTGQEIEQIRQTITDNFHLSRYRLSKMISKRLNWYTLHGELKHQALREVLVRMDREGVIKLPPPSPSYVGVRENVFNRIPIDFTEPEEEITGKLKDYSNLQLVMVKEKGDKRLWNFLIDEYHYLGYRIIVGRQIKYLVYSDNHLISCIGFSDAVLKLNLRDKWIGWSHEEKDERLHLIINNVRFLILPWVKIKNLASKLLSLSLKQVREDWASRYNYHPVLCETFVDIGKFKGSCYKAANWIYLGRTKGKGRHGQKYYWHHRPKDVYVYPLCKDALKILRGEKEWQLSSKRNKQILLWKDC